MNKDYRTCLINEINCALLNFVNVEDSRMITDKITKIMSNYEVSERCTDLVIKDNLNNMLRKRYIACIRVDGKSEKTIYQYNRIIKLFDETINKPFPQINAYDIRYYLMLERERGISNRTLDTTRASLSAFFSWLTDEEIIPKNPIAKIKPIKYTKEIKKAFSDVEIDALRRACETPRERAIVEMLISTGVRVSELATMEVQDVNIDTCLVHVVHGKGGKERITYTTPVALTYLMKYLNERQEETTALFCNEKHSPLNVGGIRVILNRIAERAGVEDVYPHRFRRTFATNLAKRGMNIQEIQSLLGHANINTTMRYVNVDETKIQASYNQYIA